MFDPGVTLFAVRMFGPSEGATKPWPLILVTTPEPPNLAPAFTVMPLVALSVPAVTTRR